MTTHIVVGLRWTVKNGKPSEAQVMLGCGLGLEDMVEGDAAMCVPHVPRFAPWACSKCVDAWPMWPRPK